MLRGEELLAYLRESRERLVDFLFHGPMEFPDSCGPCRNELWLQSVSDAFRATEVAS